MELKNILITGANGFVGRSTCCYLQSLGYSITGIVRKESNAVYEIKGPSLTNDSNWRHLLQNQDVVIHCAARVHVMRDTALDPYQAFRTINVEGTLALAKQAAEAGVKRFIFISSIKVNGEVTQPGQPFTEAVLTPPTDPYGLSKYEAEVGLLALSATSNMDVVIIRPPLIYGPGVKGNFASLIAMLSKSYPLPLGAIHNKRSLVAVGNLLDLINTCITHPAAANQVFLVSDGEDLSTSELLSKLATAMGKTSKLWSIPESILRLGLLFLGKKEISQRLFGSLQVDINKTKCLLGWVPSVSVDDGLKHCLDNTHKDDSID